jgi:hypothetical protein
MSNNAEYLLKLMKDKIDVMLEQEHVLQEFLDWLDQKSQSIQPNYKKSAVRAFYFATAYTVSSNLNRVRELELAREQVINTTNNLTNAVARPIITQ